MLEAVQRPSHAIGTDVKDGHELKTEKVGPIKFVSSWTNALPSKITNNIIIMVILPCEICLKSPPYLWRVSSV